MTTPRIGKNILIIEDETEIRNFAARVLELEGYHVLQATNADMGISLVAREPVSLLLLDLRLPGRDGWSVLAEIKDGHQLATIPVVVLSASAGAQLREKALNMGAVDYLVKPLSAAGLRKAVNHIINKKRRTKYHAN